MDTRKSRTRSWKICMIFLAALITLSFTPGAKPPRKSTSALANLAWPPPPAKARFKWVKTLRNGFDVGAQKKRSFIDRLAGKSANTLWLHRPLAVAVDAGGVLYVGDFGQGVMVMDPVKHKMWSFAQVSKMDLPTPVGIAVDSKLVYVCDANRNTLAVFDKSGHYLMGLGPQDGIKRPVGVAVDEKADRLLVVNAGANEVRLYTRQLKLVEKIGERGAKEGQFNFPSYCCFLPDGGFAVTDTGNFRVQIFDAKGRFVRTFGKVGDTSGSFSRPKGIAVDPDGHLYVVDSNFGNFQVFRQDGRLLTFVCSAGTNPGQLSLPDGIAVSKDGDIYVADQMNARIAVLKYLGSENKPGPKAEKIR